MFNFDFNNLLAIISAPLLIGGVIALIYVLISKLIKALIRMITGGYIDL